jgi:hypothetical protein
MPRLLVGLFLALLTIGCTDGSAPPILTNGDGGLDQGVTLDLAGTCMTACDCPAGQACNMGKCETFTVPVFCCSSSSCMGAAVCEFPNGMVSQCDRVDGGITPVIDGGVSTNMCEMTRCTKGAGGDVFCRLACGGTATCVGSGGNPHCMP